MDVIDLMDSESPTHNHEPAPAASPPPSKSPELEDWSQIISPDYVPDVCLMECGCCFGESDLEQMVQCGEGHLFCVECLRRYADEAIHGQGKSQLICMTADCGAPFPRSQMKRALTEEIIEKFDERVQEESLNMANLVNLVRCPGCNYAAEIVDENQQVFVCTQCSKRTCRHCRVDWTDHEGLRCNQVEKSDETTIRTKYEERMTEARIRHCPKCKAPLLKDGGCNRVTCRCGGTICYICRKLDIDYNHFCQHVGPHKNGCNKCTNCSLWTDAEEDDRRIIEQLKEQGRFERAAQGFNDDKYIGAPEEKKQQQAHCHDPFHAARYIAPMQNFGRMPVAMGFHVPVQQHIAIPLEQPPIFLADPRYVPVPALDIERAEYDAAERRRAAERHQAVLARRRQAAAERRRAISARRRADATKQWADEQQAAVAKHQAAVVKHQAAVAKRQADAAKQQADAVKRQVDADQQAYAKLQTDAASRKKVKKANLEYYIELNKNSQREKETADQVIDKHLAGLKATGQQPAVIEAAEGRLPSVLPVSLNVSIPIRHLISKNTQIIRAHSVDLLSGHSGPAGRSADFIVNNELPRFQPADVFVKAPVRAKRSETTTMPIPDTHPEQPAPVIGVVDLTGSPARLQAKSSHSKCVKNASSYPSTSKAAVDTLIFPKASLNLTANGFTTNTAKTKRKVLARVKSNEVINDQGYEASTPFTDGIPVSSQASVPSTSKTLTSFEASVLSASKSLTSSQASAPSTSKTPTRFEASVLSTGRLPVSSQASAPSTSRVSAQASAPSTTKNLTPSTLSLDFSDDEDLLFLDVSSGI